MQHKNAAQDSSQNEGHRSSCHVKAVHRVADTARLIPNKRIPAKDIANMSGIMKNYVRLSEERTG